MSSDPSPFNGDWGLNYSTDFEDYLVAFGCNEEVRQKIGEALRNYDETDGRLVERYFIDEEKGLLTRGIRYKDEEVREMAAVPFETVVEGKYFDGSPVKYIFGRENNSRNKIVRFEIGNNGTAHAMITVEVDGDQMLSVYTCVDKTFLKKWDRVYENKPLDEPSTYVRPQAP